MAINSITNSVAAQQASTYTAAKTDHTEKKSESSTKTDTGVVYEKSSGQTSGTVTKKTDYALVNKLKADAEQRTSQLRSLVEKMMTKQGVAIGTADSMWSFLAKGDFTVSAFCGSVCGHGKTGQRFVWSLYHGGRFQIADDADDNLHCLHGGRALKCRLGHLSDGGRNQRAGAASVGYADEAVLYPVLSAGGVYGAGGICDVYVRRSRDYRRDVDCGCPVFDTAVHLWTVRLHPGVQ